MNSKVELLYKCFVVLLYNKYITKTVLPDLYIKVYSQIESSN